MGILDSQKVFTLRLAEYANETEGLPFSVIPFTHIESVKQYLMKRELVYLLVGSACNFEGLEVKKVTLTDRVTSKEDEIYRYQKAADLVQEMRLRFETIMPSAIRMQLQVYGVTSAYGGSGKTTVALELLRQLPGSLYIGMEGCSSLARGTSDFGQLLYGIMQKNDNVISRLMDMAEPHGAGYVMQSPVCFGDLQVLDQEHLRWFLQRIKEEASLGSVIFDMSEALSPALVDCCDRVIILHPCEEGDFNKTENLQRAWEQQGYHTLYERAEHIYPGREGESVRQVVSGILNC